MWRSLGSPQQWQRKVHYDKGRTRKDRGRYGESQGSWGFVVTKAERAKLEAVVGRQVKARVDETVAEILGRQPATVAPREKAISSISLEVAIDSGLLTLEDDLTELVQIAQVMRKKFA